MTEEHHVSRDTRLAFRDGLQIAWDATSLSALKECPRKYQYQIVQSWTFPGSNKDIDFGSYFHTALEEYHKHVHSGVPHHVAVRTVVRATLERTGKRDTYCPGCHHCDSNSTRYELRGDESGRVTHHRWLCDSCGISDGGAFREGEPPLEWTPWDSGDTGKNRYTLVRTIVWYLDQYGKQDPLVVAVLPDGRPAVELSFRFEIDLHNPWGDPYWFCGHLDLAGYLNDQLYIVDHKTTGTTLSSSFFEQFSPDNQMSLYSFAGQVVFDQPVAGVIVDAAQIGVGFSRFARGFASRTGKQIAEWYEDTKAYIQAAESYHRNQYYPMNDKACFRCHFKKICSRDPSVRDMFLRNEFVKREGWDPLKIR